MTNNKDTERAQEQARAQYESIKELVHALRQAQEAKNDEREENAREAIEQDALDVSVRNTSWHTPGEDDEASKPDEYAILLCTGGPAVRITGDLDEYGQPETAYIEYQDWFTPWEVWPGGDEETLLEYARVFYFGE